MKTAAVVAVAILAAALSACGGSSGPSATATASAKATTLLPNVSEAPAGLTVSQPAFPQTADATTLLTTFPKDEARAVAGQLASLAEVDFSGPKSAFAYAHVYVFKSLDDATAAAPGFLDANKLTTDLAAPADAPGDESQASTQDYASGKSTSFRVVFRDHNVLSYIEVDGPNGTFSVDDAVALANAEDARIQAALQ